MLCEAYYGPLLLRHEGRHLPLRFRLLLLASIGSGQDHADQSRQSQQRHFCLR